MVFENKNSQKNKTVISKEITKKKEGKKHQNIRTDITNKKKMKEKQRFLDEEIGSLIQVFLSI